MTLYPDWWEKHKGETLLPKPIRVMRAKFGTCDDHKCGECKHLITTGNTNTYFKCDLTKITSGAATDWRKSWPACGKFIEGKGD